MASNGSSTSRVIQSQDQQQQQLKCPRCDSTNTKFCYYNNYSLSQPRHFCKACKRYWTRGGTLRNVPVGGTCRKSKKIKKPSLIMPTPNTTSAATNHISPLFYGLPTNPYISGLGFPPNQQIQDHDAVTTTISPSIVSSYPIFGSTSIRSNSTLASLIATSNNCQDLSHGEGGNEETINNCFSWSGAGPWFDPSETHSLL